MVATISNGTPHLGSKRLWHNIYRKAQRLLRKSPSIGNGLLPVEILQQIFYYLDTWGLYCCHDVCRLWKYCTPGTSSALRTAMFLPLPNNNQTSTQTPRYSATFYYGVILHADFDHTSEKHQHVTDYTVRSHTCGIIRSPEHGTSFNPILQFDMTRSNLKRYKRIWDRNDNKPKPLWMTAIVCSPPTDSITLRLEFMRTVLPANNSSQHASDKEKPYRTTRTINNNTCFMIGDLLCAIWEDVHWPELVLREDMNRNQKYFRVLPSERTMSRTKKVEEVLRKKRMGPPERFFPQFTWKL
jgi:hypothetical protein